MTAPRVLVIGHPANLNADTEHTARGLGVQSRKQMTIIREPHAMRGRRAADMLVLTEAFLREHTTEGERETLFQRPTHIRGGYVAPAYTTILLLLNGWADNPTGLRAHLIAYVSREVIPFAAATHGVR